jgi:murein DD-endopeptidase MepM/ murein hydrolase activator NlpD
MIEPHDGQPARSTRKNDGLGLRAPRLPFLVALAMGLLSWWLAGDPTPPAPRQVMASTTPTPPAIVDTLQPNQTLSGVWAEHGLPPEDLPAVVHAGQSLLPWRSLRPGSVYKFLFASDSTLRTIDLKVDRDRRLVVHRAGPLFRAELIETEFVRKNRALSACVEGSPWQALSDAGEDPTLVVQMGEILAAQVDFYTDLRPEDCFELAFEVDERPDGSYRLVGLDAVRLALRDRTVEAYRFSMDGGTPEWYDSEGQSLKRMFLRSPLKFARISSGFGMRRHPILRRMRAHNGVDYVAPVGTPVQASGDGVVLQAGRNGGHGLYIKLQHGRRYSTSYSHLSRIASGVRTGARVQQGQVIGYVGSTGMSTGAHLDYRFIKDGKYVDPLSTDLPTANPLEDGQLAAFRTARDLLRQRLDAVDGVSSPSVVPAR